MQASVQRPRYAARPENPTARPPIATVVGADRGRMWAAATIGGLAPSSARYRVSATARRAFTSRATAHLARIADRSAVTPVQAHIDLADQRSDVARRHPADYRPHRSPWARRHTRSTRSTSSGHATCHCSGPSQAQRQVNATEQCHVRIVANHVQRAMLDHMCCTTLLSSSRSARQQPGESDTAPSALQLPEQSMWSDTRYDTQTT